MSRPTARFGAALPRRPATPRHAVLTAFAVGGAALLLYGLTAAHGVEWQDPAFHQLRIVTGRILHPLGLALSHPLHYWLGRGVLHLPVFETLHRLNLLSALCGAAGVALLAGLLVRLTGSVFAAGIGVATAALSHAYWQMSALTETYTLAAALMALEWVLLFRYLRTRRTAWLIAVFLVNGLHVADHMLGVLTLSTYGVFLLILLARRRVRLIHALIAAAAWIIGASPYLALCTAYYQHTHSLVATIRSALFGGGTDVPGWAGDVLNTHLSMRQVKLAVMTFGYCFPSAAALLALFGVFRRTHGPRRVFRRLLLAQTVIIGGFVARYTIVDLYTYFVPICMLMGLWVGWGAAALLRRLPHMTARRWLAAALVVNALLPVVVYLTFPPLARARGWMRGNLRDLPYRDEYAAFFQPWRCQDHSAREFADAALQRCAPGDWILADSTTAPVIAVVEHIAPPPAGPVYVYWPPLCLSHPARPHLTAETLAHYVNGGGHALGVPAAIVESLLPAELAAEPDGPFWNIIPCVHSAGQEPGGG